MRHPCGNISGKILRVFPTQSYLFQIFIHSVSISLLWSTSSLLFHFQEPVLQIVLLVLWLVSECKTRVMQTWHRLSLVTVSCNAFKFVLSISSSSVTYDMPKCCVCVWKMNSLVCWRQSKQHTLLQEQAGTAPCSAVRSSVDDAVQPRAVYASDALSAQTAQVHNSTRYMWLHCKQLVKEFWQEAASPPRTCQPTAREFWSCTLALMCCPLQTSLQPDDAAEFAAYTV